MSQLNELEQAIIEEIAKDYPELGQKISELSVTKREYTGAGSYTDFSRINEPIKVKGGFQILNLGKIIHVPSVEYGLGAHIEMDEGIPKFLEIYTFGTQVWDGSSSEYEFRYE